MTAAAPTGFRKHLEGWQWAMWVVGAALLSALLVVPRAVKPEVVPPPRVDRLQQHREIRIEEQRAERAAAGLPLDVRAVGEAVRRVGEATFDAGSAGPQFQDQARRLAQVAIERHGAERLLELRALQARLFAAATGRRQGSGEAASAELRELGGRFAAVGLASGWFAADGSGADDVERSLLFRMYWSEMLGLAQKHPYAPTLNEWRAYYRFMLSRPLAPDAARSADVDRRLGYVAALSRHDPDYPAHLARGVLLYWNGAHADAAAELYAHLQQHPDGPWSLRARNYLAACGAALIE